MPFFKLTQITKDDNESVLFINPEHLTSLRPAETGIGSFVNVLGDNTYHVKETFDEIDKRLKTTEAYCQ